MDDNPYRSPEAGRERQSVEPIRSHMRSLAVAISIWLVMAVIAGLAVFYFG